jgi:hypothetical protein
MDYTAVGQTTHLAARMEQLATPGTVRLTAETLRLAEGYVIVKPLGPMPVKGIAHPVEVYELSGAAAVRTRLQAARARGLTHFVGRQAEIAQMQTAVAQARKGKARFSQSWANQALVNLACSSNSCSHITLMVGSYSKQVRFRSAKRRPICRSSTL